MTSLYPIMTSHHSDFYSKMYINTYKQTDPLFTCIFCIFCTQIKFISLMFCAKMCFHPCWISAFIIRALDKRGTSRSWLNSRCILLHHLMFQHNNARSHVTRICTQFLEAENVPVLPWSAYSPDVSPIEHVWDALDRRVRQCSSSRQYPVTSHSHWRGVGQHSTGHNQQPDQL